MKTSTYPNQAIATITKKHIGTRELARISGKAPGTVARWFNGSARPLDGPRRIIEGKLDVPRGDWDRAPVVTVRKSVTSQKVKLALATGDEPREGPTIEIDQIASARRAAFEDGRFAEGLGLVATEIGALKAHARATGELATASRIARQPPLGKFVALVLETLKPHSAALEDVERFFEQRGAIPGRRKQGATESALNELLGELETVRDSFGEGHKLFAKTLRSVRQVKAAIDWFNGEEAALMQTAEWVDFVKSCCAVFLPRHLDALDAVVEVTNEVLEPSE